MLRVPEERFPRQDPAALAGFFGFCREEARRDGRARIGSISLEVPHIDPLAVLQSIYEPHELHFYLEKPSTGEAIAGAGCRRVGHVSPARTQVCRGSRVGGRSAARV